MRHPTIARLRDGTEVAAWLLKANPGVWDVIGALESGTGLDVWRLAFSYRVGLVSPGHPCVLWVTGGRRSSSAGAWAFGSIVAPPFLDTGDPGDPAWADVVDAGQVRPYVRTRLDVLTTPVRLADLVEDPRFSTCEVVRAPRVASPVALRSAEWSTLLEAAGLSA